MTVPERPTRILVVDDEEQIRRALKSILSTRGYELEMAATAEEALLKAIDAPPDLVVLDLALPDRSGIEVCRELRTWMTAPILILSVQGQRGRQDPGARRGRRRLPHQAVLGRRAAGPHPRPAAPGGGAHVAAARRDGGRPRDRHRPPARHAAGDEVALTPTEFDILAFLARNAELRRHPAA